MKKFLSICVTAVLAAGLLVGCGGGENPAEEPAPISTPEEYCAAFDDADIIIGDDGSFYVEASRVNWATELDLQDATPVAVVARSGVTVDFEAWDATVLPAGTPIARHNQEDEVLVADRDGEGVPYLKYAG